MLDIRRTPDYAEILVEKDVANDATLRYEVQNDRVRLPIFGASVHNALQISACVEV